MSNGDDEPADEPGAGADEAPEVEADEERTLADHLDAAGDALDVEDPGREAFEAALDDLEAALEVAGTEADLDDLEASVDELSDALADADLPAPDEGDEEAEDPREALESRVSEFREAIEEARGPYAEDVTEALEGAASTIRETRWTDDGEAAVAEAVESFLASADDAIEVGVDVAAGDEEVESLAAGLESAAEAVASADLDPDGDAETIGALLEAADDLSTGLEDAEEWSDLTTREQLRAEGFYDVLEHRKDYPPEWHALKVHEKRGNAGMILLALEKLESDFMEDHCLEALLRMGSEEALEPMLQRAERRDRDAIEIIGKIGSEGAVDTLVEYVDEGDPALARTTLKALGEIGSREATQAVADALEDETDSVRSNAARALGMIGDTRAIDPLAATAESDGADEVRASAVWALVQIGTERALEAAAAHADDRSYLVQVEAERAADALDATQAA